MEKEIIDFRNGIFELKTRRFGKVAELMIQKIFDLKESDSIFYDLKAKTKEKIEVKFSRVLKKCDSNINFKNLLSSVIASNIENRTLTFEEAKKNVFDCNIQQVKRKEFDYLYYGCFFEDRILICKIKSDKIASDPNIFYSDHQHKDNVGEGQFHINNSTLEHHLNEYFVKWLTYEELYNLFK